MSLIEHGQVVFGVVGVLLPVLFITAAQVWCFCRDDGATRSYTCAAPQMNWLWLPVKTQQPKQNFARALGGQLSGAALVNVGSSLKFCQMVEGAADLYRLAPTSQ